MLKWFLVGWVCVSVSSEHKCLRMASEVVHPTLEQCQQYYGVFYEELMNKPIIKSIDFHCVQASILEDLI
tara:strand:- start:127 stop:336 length:210 start_codon:yes stop_codon:yes gene_type:complete